MIVNGEEHFLQKPTDLESLLKEAGWKLEGVVVELNGKIIKQSEFKTTIIDTEDVLEVVSFVGGG